jgi:hypothetical protein
MIEISSGVRRNSGFFSLLYNWFVICGVLGLLVLGSKCQFLRYYICIHESTLFSPILSGYMGSLSLWYLSQMKNRTLSWNVIVKLVVLTLSLTGKFSSFHWSKMLGYHGLSLKVEKEKRMCVEWLP